jgi:hypothetical protein
MLKLAEMPGGHPCLIDAKATAWRLSKWHFPERPDPSFWSRAPARTLHSAKSIGFFTTLAVWFQQAAFNREDREVKAAKDAKKNTRQGLDVFLYFAAVPFATFAVKGFCSTKSGRHATATA